jgi:hypothetical protein
MALKKEWVERKSSVIGDKVYEHMSRWWPDELVDLCIQYVGKLGLEWNLTSHDLKTVSVRKYSPYKIDLKKHWDPMTEFLLKDERFGDVLELIDHQPQNLSWHSHNDLLCGNDIHFKTVVSMNPLSICSDWSVLFTIPEDFFSWELPVCKFGVIHIPTHHLPPEPRVIGGRHKHSKHIVSRVGIMLKTISGKLQIVPIEGSHYRKDAENRRSEYFNRTNTILKIKGQYIPSTHEFRIQIFRDDMIELPIYRHSIRLPFRKFSTSCTSGNINADWIFPYIALGTHAAKFLNKSYPLRLPTATIIHQD